MQHAHIYDPVTLVLCCMFYVLQWNAMSLVANGQELKKVDLTCLQETHV